NLPWDVVRIKSILKEIKVRQHFMEQIGAAYMAEGIVTLAGSRMYTSLADTNDIIDDALERFGRVLANVEP
ncbi:MAG: aspartate aminotransferase family protein, partial [Candidatus Thorarchaeota archaeon]